MNNSQWKTPAGGRVFRSQGICGTGCPIGGGYAAYWRNKRRDEKEGLRRRNRAVSIR